LFFGSVEQSWVALWTVLLSICTLCGVAKPMNVWQWRVLYIFLAVCAAYAIVAVLQVAPDLIDRFDDPIWHRASTLLETSLPSRISSRSEIPPVIVGHFLLVVTSFISGFFIGVSRSDSDALMGFARYSVLIYAVYGVFSLAVTPEMLLWEPKVAYRGSLTATFVNHNTAATFVGMGAILWFCPAITTLQSMQFSSLRLLLLVPSNERIAFKFILRSGAGLVCFIAVLLTGSRGGLICSCIGLLVAVGLMLAGQVKTSFWYILGLAAAALALMLTWLTHIGRIGSQGLLDEGRWLVYGYCIEAIRQRPLLGMGAGTFEDVFPSLRPPDFSKWGVWDYAHSTTLEIAFEMGVPVAIMIVCAAIASLFLLARATVRSKNQSRSSFAAAAGVATLAYTHSLIDFSLQIPGFFIVFWILLGSSLAQSLESESREDLQRKRGARTVTRSENSVSQSKVAAISGV
jgi:O-antigen ligase